MAARKRPAGPRGSASFGEPRPQSMLPTLERPRLGGTDRAASLGNERVALSLEGMHCASCVSTIEGALAAVPGVEEASVNLGTAQAHVRGRGLEPERLVAAVRESGYGASLLGDA